MRGVVRAGAEMQLDPRLVSAYGDVRETYARVIPCGRFSLTRGIRPGQVRAGPGTVFQYLSPELVRAMSP